MITKKDLDYTGPMQQHEGTWISFVSVGIASSYEFKDIDEHPSQAQEDAAREMMKDEVIDKIYGEVIRELLRARIHIKNGDAAAADEILKELIRSIRDAK